MEVDLKRPGLLGPDSLSKSEEWVKALQTIADEMDKRDSSWKCQTNRATTEAR